MQLNFWKIFKYIWIKFKKIFNTSTKKYEKIQTLRCLKVKKKTINLSSLSRQFHIDCPDIFTRVVC